LARHDPSARILALDYDGTILPRTRDYLSSHGVVNTTICQAVAKHLPFRASTFDLVLCLYGLHHCRGYLEALREIARVLKLDGTLALIDPVRKPGKPPGGHHGTEVLTGQELQQMLGKAGFRSVPPRVSIGRAKAVVRKVAT
jgi:ubiquinone/menaquinone biosynthesis C-methylase UbiE